MRVVCDTNVLVSAFLSPYGASARIVELFFEGKIGLCYDTRILAEYEEVLTRPKFSIPKARIRLVLDAVRLEGEMVSGSVTSVKLRDPDDQPFLNVAIAGRVECLVTGNVDDFQGHRPPPFIYSPARLLDRYRTL